ncbi:SDR family oxidoreductase [Neobacillus drentensis]|uniref:SDR family NAD(P)-dependent oxidoreductase n=1 Tax=Neobacillus drentensis TaxID=220684 RepID=UPI0030007FE0
MKIWNLFNLEHKVAFVTGGARNLGYDMALSLAEAGADVAITSRKLEDAERAAASIQKLTGRKAIGITMDVKDFEQIERAVDRAVEFFGKIDILVNNAGNVESTSENAPFEKRPLNEWQHVIDVNLTGVFLCSQYVVSKAMLPQKSGNIINISSVAGITGKDRRVYLNTEIGGSTIDYHAAKAGVINMTRDMAVHLAPQGIRVNCISPGPFGRDQPKNFVEAYSNLIPMGRFGIEGKEVNGAVVYLASEASSYVTGQNLVIDGGLTAW